ncbi:DUF3526 domain-containing protein [Cystobacter fuscus]
MSTWTAELRLLLRAPLSAGALVLLLLLTALSVAAGLAATARQSAVIERVEAAQGLDPASVTQEYGKPGAEAGSAAYYTFHLTTDPPSPLAFAALGQRDVQPYVLRVRLLGLHSQLYESETLNPELALPGAFDFAFVLIYLAPLVIIALMHELVSGEREAGRLRLLVSLPASGLGVWGRRGLLRYLLVLGALLVPFYRQSLTAREEWAARLGWLLPAAAVQTFLHRAADSDLRAQLAYQRGIESFHTRLRDFYYPYLFHERPFQRADFERLPRHEPRPSSASLPLAPLLGLLVLTALASGAAIRGVRALSSFAAQEGR